MSSLGAFQGVGPPQGAGTCHCTDRAACILRSSCFGSSHPLQNPVLSPLPHPQKQRFLFSLSKFPASTCHLKGCGSSASSHRNVGDQHGPPGPAPWRLMLPGNRGHQPRESQGETWFAKGKCEDLQHAGGTSEHTRLPPVLAPSTAHQRV